MAEATDEKVALEYQSVFDARTKYIQELVDYLTELRRRLWDRRREHIAIHTACSVQGHPSPILIARRVVLDEECACLERVIQTFGERIAKIAVATLSDCTKHKWSHDYDSLVTVERGNQ